MRITLPISLPMLVAAMTGPGSFAQQSPSSPPRGTGAQFLPMDTTFYLQIKARRGSEDLRQVSRLAAVYAASPELLQLSHNIERSIGYSLDELRAKVELWVGEELFIAVPEADDFLKISLPRVRWGAPCYEPAVLIGARVRDLLGFLTFVGEFAGRAPSIGAEVADASYRGHLIYRFGQEEAEGGSLFASFDRGFLLVSQSRQLLLSALDRDSGTSLESSAAFSAASTNVAQGSLGFAYVSPAGASVLLALGENAPVRWAAGALRLESDRVTADFALSVDRPALSPTTLRLFEKSPNGLRAARLGPTDSTLFLGWDNLKALWDQVVEVVWPDPQVYAGVRQRSLAELGLDLEEDLFGWMTGEVALFAAPSPASFWFGLSAPDLGHSMGMAIEAKDMVVAREKLDKIASAFETMMQVACGKDESEAASVETLNGVAFQRIPVPREEALFLGLADGWVIVAGNEQMAASIAASIRGASGLDTSPGYARARQQLPTTMHFAGYLNMPQVVEFSPDLLTLARGGLESSPYPRAIRSVGFGVTTSTTEILGTLYAEVTIPDGVVAFPSDPTSFPGASGLGATLDLSHAGEVNTGPGRFAWVLPPGGHFVRSETDATTMAYRARGEYVMPLRGRLAVRLGSSGSYTAYVLSAYRDFVRCGGTLVLLSDGKAPGETDPVAQIFGMTVGGTAQAKDKGIDVVMDRFVQGPLVSQLEPFRMDGGTGLVAWDRYTMPLGYLSERAYLDQDGDEHWTDDEPDGAPALAMRRYGRGRVLFLGSTQVLDPSGPQILWQLLGALFPGGPSSL
jgi:hypothetical protein